MLWPARLPRTPAKLAELLFEHAWASRARGGSARVWLLIVESKTTNRRVRQLAPHVAALVWSGFFDELDDDESVG